MCLSWSTCGLLNEKNSFDFQHNGEGYIKLGYFCTRDNCNSNSTSNYETTCTA